MTHLNLLNKLPSPIREQAIENAKIKHKGSNGQWLNMSHYPTLAEALRYAFNWRTCTQGSDYWVAVHSRILRGEFDDPSVTLPREDWQRIISSLKKNGYGELANQVTQTVFPITA